MKTMKQLASAIAKLEGKKSQVKIGDIREILGILSDMLWADNGLNVFKVLLTNGKRRARRKK